jgi:formylglycine-generating enzyme required for sulfatase activity/predicted Ser/Thr protein kinase
MSLSGQQVKQLQDALIDAYLDKVSLEQMLLTKLDKKLRTIADEGNLKDIIFKLIQIADSDGWVEDLVCGAYNDKSGNQGLQRFIQKISLKMSSDLRTIIEGKLKDEYDDLEELGMGAFGVTYRANIKDQPNYVVIKTIKIDELFQIIKNNNQEMKKCFTQEIKSFEKEAEFLSSFKHNHIVKYQDHLTQKMRLIINNKQDKKLYSVYELELPFLVMEYIEGENLEELTSKRDSPLEEAEALRYIQQIGEALNIVHNKGVLHRDIKPKNIMVREDENDAVLIDFGIAREFIPNVTQAHTVAFTQGYAPPEQLNPKAQRGKYTDVYGLAATLYYLLTQKHPIHVLNRINQSLVEPKKLNPNISDRVNKAIIWGMELEASKRPQTVEEWMKNLLSKESVSPTPLVFRFEVVTVNDQGKEVNRKQGQAEYIVSDLGNGVKLEMVSIPGGKFLMGSPEGTGYSDEKPQHEVTVQPFFMGKYQVTQAQWKIVAKLPRVDRDLKTDPSYFKGDKRPVEDVFWNDAVEFCDRLSQYTGRAYRLPSEAEWEYACRAGTATAFHFGETITTDLANYRGTDNEEYKWSGSYGDGPKGIYREETTEVGSFGVANNFGLYDIHGNVWEWCQDDYHDNYEGAPIDGSAWINENDNKYRVLRGGSWNYSPDFCRSAYRIRLSPDLRDFAIGFRVVLSGVARTLP